MSNTMTKMRSYIPNGMPLLVFLYGAIITPVLSVVFGLPAMFGEGLEPLWTIGWGGREIGIGLISLVALFSKSLPVYLAAFVAAVFRELSDVIEQASEVSPTFAGIANPGVFLVVDIVCLGFAISAMTSNVADPKVIESEVV